jgi:hypothetical protein
MRVSFVLFALTSCMGSIHVYAQAKNQGPQLQELLQADWPTPERVPFGVDANVPPSDKPEADAKAAAARTQDAMNRTTAPSIASDEGMGAEGTSASLNGKSPDAPQPTTAAPSETALPQDAPPTPPPPEPVVTKPEFEIYGFAMLDMGYDFGQENPDWFDVERPTQLPAFPHEYGDNGNLYSGVRQTRFGVKSLVPTKYGDLKTVFEFELFGVGVDAGQTTFRLRQAYGELGQFLAGQTWSPYMDPDVFPNSIEYWGPNGMVFFRNVQFRWQPVHNENHQVMIALERPGASADLQSVQDLYILQGVQFRFPAPDVSGRVRYGGKRTYIQVAGIYRFIHWDDLTPTSVTNLTGSTNGWGVNISSNVGFGAKDTLKLQIKDGAGDENYMNDAVVDVAPKLTTNIHKPLTGEPLPDLGIVAFYDHYWNKKWSSSVGYSLFNTTNATLQVPSSFRRGMYGIANLLYYPVDNVMGGGEFIWGRRDNFTDGWVYDDYRIQFSFRYNFSFKFGGP